VVAWFGSDAPGVARRPARRRRIWNPSRRPPTSGGWPARPPCSFTRPRSAAYPAVRASIHRGMADLDPTGGGAVRVGREQGREEAEGGRWQLAQNSAGERRESPRGCAMVGVLLQNATTLAAFAGAGIVLLASSFCRCRAICSICRRRCNGDARGCGCRGWRQWRLDLFSMFLYGLKIKEVNHFSFVNKRLHSSYITFDHNTCKIHVRILLVRKVIPTLTSTSAEIYLSMVGAKQLNDMRFILVPAGAVRPAEVCSRHYIALHRGACKGELQAWRERRRSLQLPEVWLRQSVNIVVKAESVWVCTVSVRRGKGTASSFYRPRGGSLQSCRTVSTTYGGMVHSVVE
jgi:hypothetical protein